MPRSAALVIVEPNSSEGTNLWAKYLANWTLWNHIWTIAAIAAAALLTIALGDRSAH